MTAEIKELSFLAELDVIGKIKDHKLSFSSEKSGSPGQSWSRL